MPRLNMAKTAFQRVIPSHGIHEKVTEKKFNQRGPEKKMKKKKPNGGSLKKIPIAKIRTPLPRLLMVDP